ncbi:hypothetical protein DPSP01_005094 [Paraphaeosphaeria sporulosa]
MPCSSPRNRCRGPLFMPASRADRQHAQSQAANLERPRIETERHHAIVVHVDDHESADHKMHSITGWSFLKAVPTIRRIDPRGMTWLSVKLAENLVLDRDLDSAKYPKAQHL